MVLLGLIFESFGHLKNFPNMYPPISEHIHVSKKIKINIFKLTNEVKINNAEKNKKM